MNEPVKARAAVKAAYRSEALSTLEGYGFAFGEGKKNRFSVTDPKGQALNIRLLTRPHIDPAQCGIDLWLMFPFVPKTRQKAQKWFLIPHDTLYAWMEERHGHASGWGSVWSYPKFTKAIAEFLTDFELRPLSGSA